MLLFSRDLRESLRDLEMGPRERGLATCPQGTQMPEADR